MGESDDDETLQYGSKYEEDVDGDEVDEDWEDVDGDEVDEGREDVDSDNNLLCSTRPIFTGNYTPYFPSYTAAALSLFLANSRLSRSSLTNSQPLPVTSRRMQKVTSRASDPSGSRSQPKAVSSRCM